MAFKKRMDDPKYHIVLKMIKKKSDTMQYSSYNEFENNEKKI